MLEVGSPDGHAATLALTLPPGARDGVLWLPAMGVPARKYGAWAEALAAHGIATALHEWRGGGTSNVRASRRRDWGYRTLFDDVARSRAALEEGAPGVRWHIGGHSLGAQLAALAHALTPHDYAGLAIVGAGLPWWRSFPRFERPFVLGVFGFFRLLGAVVGHYPGATVGFAGREARGVIRDWTRSGLTGRYRPDGEPRDLDAALASLATPLLAVHLANDRYVPAPSLAALVAKLPRSSVTAHELDAGRFASRRADHFGWMKEPGPVASVLVAWLAAPRVPLV